MRNYDRECETCNRTLPVTEFHQRGRGEVRKDCKTCFNQYRANRQHRYRKKQKESRKNRIQEKRDFIWQYLESHVCEGCGERDKVVLEFHHKDPSEKFRNVNTLVSYNYSMDRLHEEIKKCTVLCANCHRREEARTRGYWSYERQKCEENKTVI